MKKCETYKSLINPFVILALLFTGWWWLAIILYLVIHKPKCVICLTEIISRIEYKKVIKPIIKFDSEYITYKDKKVYLTQDETNEIISVIKKKNALDLWRNECK